MNVRDKLLMQLLGWRQLVMDMPEEQIPSVRMLLIQLEEELKRLKEKR